MLLLLVTRWEYGVETAPPEAEPASLSFLLAETRCDGLGADA